MSTKRKSPTAAQLEQRRLAWLLFVTLGAAQNMASAQGMLFFSPNNKRQRRLAAKVSKALVALNEVSFEVHSQLNSIDGTYDKL